MAQVSKKAKAGVVGAVLAAALVVGAGSAYAAAQQPACCDEVDSCCANAEQVIAETSAAQTPAIVEVEDCC